MTPLHYVSIDLETTGLDPDNHDVIEFGAILDYVGNTTPVEKLPSFHAYLSRNLYCGEAYALSMHPVIFRRIAMREPGFNYFTPECLGPEFAAFLAANNYDLDKTNKFSIVCAGKNFASFDYRFLLQIPRFTEAIKIAHRSLDPMMLYFDPKTMSKLPSLKDCMTLAGLTDDVKHTAIEDAMDVIRLLRFKWSS